MGPSRRERCAATIGGGQESLPPLPRLRARSRLVHVLALLLGLTAGAAGVAHAQPGGGPTPGTAASATTPYRYSAHSVVSPAHLPARRRRMARRPVSPPAPAAGWPGATSPVVADRGRMPAVDRPASAAPVRRRSRAPPPRGRPHATPPEPSPAGLSLAAAGLPPILQISRAPVAAAPSFMAPAGPVADRLADLGWVLTAIAALVALVVAVLLVWGTFANRGRRARDLARTGRGIRWIVVGGVIVPGLVLPAVFVYGLVTQAALAGPAGEPGLSVEVRGHRWWWEITYRSEDASRVFTTANELHLPVGVPVRVELESADVIHSFWIPQLAGKRDLIPGRRNEMWVEAGRPGVFYGQCAEYCGVQHAHMALAVVAESPAEFERWRARQLRPARPPADSLARRGEAVFLDSGCLACHAVRGTPAGGAVGPDLTHFGSRRTIAAGLLPNTLGHLSGWIADPQRIKPGNQMPRVPLAATELRAVAAYLESLQ